MQGATAGGAIRETLDRAPGLGRVVAWMDGVGLDLEDELRRLIGDYARDASRLLQGSGGRVGRPCASIKSDRRRHPNSPGDSGSGQAGPSFRAPERMAGI
jgi:hypothetical protein